MSLHINVPKQGRKFSQTGVGLFFFCAVTGQLFYLMWLYEVRLDLLNEGYKELPPVWMLVIPGLHIIGVWELSKYIQDFSNGKLKRFPTTITMSFLGLGAAIMQDRFNDLQG